MTRLLLAFLLGLILGMAYRRTTQDTTLRARYDAVRRSEAGGSVDLGIAWGDL